MLLKTLLVAFLISLVASEQYVFGDCDDDDVVVNINLPACCSGNGNGGPNPSATVWPVGLLVDDNNSTLSSMMIEAARLSVALINQDLLAENAAVKLGDLSIANTQGTASGTKAAINQLVYQGNVHFAAGPVDCSGVQAAVEAVKDISIAQNFMTIIPGVVGSCSSVNKLQDSVFMFGSPDTTLASTIAKVTNNRNVYIVSTFGNSGADSLFQALLNEFGDVFPSMNVRRLRFAPNGPDIPNLVRDKIRFDLTQFDAGEVTVILENLSQTELRNSLPLIVSESNRFTRFLTTGFDAPLDQLPADLLFTLSQLPLIEVTDGLRQSSVSAEVRADFLANGVAYTPITARIYDAYYAISVALKDPRFRLAVNEEVPGMRNKLFIDIMDGVLGASSWLALDNLGDSIDGIFVLRQLQSDGTWLETGGSMDYGAWW